MAKENSKKNSFNFKKIKHYWEDPLLLICALLMLVGIVLSFFFMYIGGILVGLATGLYFSEEIKSYFLQLRDYYPLQGLFSTLMALGVALYLLLSIPLFLISAAVGMGIMLLLRQFRK